MTKIEKFQCDICKQEFAAESDAIKCEAQGVTPPKFKVGDVVFAWFKYCKKEKPFCKRRVKRVFIDERHEAGYELDQVVLVGRDFTIGGYSWFDDESE